jgi:hypothetical protein
MLGAGPAPLSDTLGGPHASELGLALACYAGVGPEGTLVGDAGKLLFL